MDSSVLKQEEGASSERKKLLVEAQRGTKASSNTLVALLQMRQQGMEITAKKHQEANTTGKPCDLTKDYKDETQMSSMEPNWANDKQMNVS